MAATKIADIIIPGSEGMFSDYTIQLTTERSALFTSGIVAPVAGLDVFGQRGGTTLSLPFWTDLDGVEEVLSDTVPLSVDKIDAASDRAILHARGKAWGVNDLARALSGEDPMGVIAGLVANWWNRRLQKMLISTLKGVFAAASMSANVSNISAAGGSAAVISGDTIIDAIYKLGDAADQLSAIITHSAVVATLAKQQLIDYRPEAEGRPNVPFYMDKRVIVDDGMAVAAGVYTTYLFGPGAIGWGDGGAPYPTETDRDTLQGDDILVNRRHFVLHPRGVKFTGTPAGVSPTNTELETGTNWLRAYDPKNIKIVQFVHRIVAV